MKLLNLGLFKSLLLVLIFFTGCSGDGESESSEAELQFLDIDKKLIIQKSLDIFENDDFQIIVKAKNQGDFLVNKAVSFNITRGTLTAQGNKTNDKGESLFTLNIKNVLGQVELNAVLDYETKIIRKTLILNVISNKPSLTLTLLDEDNNAYGVESTPMNNTKDALVSARLVRPSGDVVTQALVNFQTTLGELSLNLVNTDSEGTAKVSLSTSSAGVGVLTASVNVDDEYIETSTNVYSNYDYGSPRIGVLINEVFTIAGMWVSDPLNNQISGNDIFSPVKNNHPLLHGEQAKLRVNILSEFDDTVIFPQPVVVTFSSICADIGKATFGVDELSTAIVASSSGIAESTYITDECFYEDEIKATFNFNSITYVARATIDLPLPEVDVLGDFQSDINKLVMTGVKRKDYPLLPFALVAEYDDPFSVPNNELEFLWQRESTDFSFKVIAEDGEPLVGQSVNFSVGLNATADPQLLTYTEISNAQGKVSGTVSAGDVPGEFSIIAQTGSGINTLVSISPPLKVSSGIPVDGGLTITPTMINPNAWGKDGVIVTFIASVRDRLGEIAQNGTIILFDTEFGQLSKSFCITQNGYCSVNWSSLASDTSHPSARDTATNNGFDGKNDRFGRSILTAMVLGEERFIDGDGGGELDNRYDETLESAGHTNLPEVFFDYNENTYRDSGFYNEGYYDLNDNNSYDLADSIFQGGACILSSSQCTDYILIHKSIKFTLSSNVLKLYLSKDVMNNSLISNYTIVADTTLVMDSSVTLITDPTPSFVIPSMGTQLYFGLTDRNGNSAPFGTQIEVVANVPGIGFTSANQNVQSSNLSFFIEAGTEAYFDWFKIFVNAGVVGSAKIRIISPDGVVTEKTLLLEGEI